MKRENKYRIVIAVLVLSMIITTGAAYVRMAMPTNGQEPSAEEQQLELESMEKEKENAEKMTQARKVVTSYFNALQEGDPNLADTFLSEDAADVWDVKSSFDEFLEQIEDQPENAKQISTDYMKTTLKENVRDYILSSSRQSEDGDEVSYIVEVKSVDSSKVEEVDQNDSINQVNQYMEDHQQELLEMMESQGEEALQNYLAGMQLEIYYDQMTKVLQEAPAVSIQLVVDVQNLEGGWKITSVQFPQEAAE